MKNRVFKATGLIILGSLILGNAFAAPPVNLNLPNRDPFNLLNFVKVVEITLPPSNTTQAETGLATGISSSSGNPTTASVSSYTPNYTLNSVESTTVLQCTNGNYVQFKSYRVYGQSVACMHIVEVGNRKVWYKVCSRETAGKLACNE